MPRARIAAGFGCGRKLEFVLCREFGLDGAALAVRAGQQFRQMMIALRPDHDIDHRGAADDLTAFGLRDATGHRDAHVAPRAGGVILGKAQPAELRIDFLGRLFANVAGVEDHQVGIIDARGLDKAVPRQRVHHALRIVDVHLAAIGLDMQLARRLHETRMLAWNGAKAARGSDIV